MMNQLPPKLYGCSDYIVNRFRSIFLHGKIRILQSLSMCIRADFSFVPSQWDMVLLCNDVSHWFKHISLTIGEQSCDYINSSCCLSLAGNKPKISPVYEQHQTFIYHIYQLNQCWITVSWTTTETSPSMNCIWKCCLQNGGHFIQGPIYEFGLSV